MKIKNKKFIEKLHKQFGHPTSDKFVRLIKNVGCDNSPIENESVEITNSLLFLKT